MDVNTEAEKVNTQIYFGNWNGYSHLLIILESNDEIEN